ncbi:hypothetical protein PG994_010839 [Apiospora phragmitis]|uniref:DUF7892 domain-containing protein n=1 Tax=Apiospora phragmitis TaxID=2905665 RepID=A0ABR1TR42_9PEZI
MVGTSEQASFDVVAPASLHAEREDQSMTMEISSSLCKSGDTSSPNILMSSGTDVGERSSSDQHKIADAIGASYPTVVNHSSETNSETRKRKSSHDEHPAPNAEQMTKRAKVEETLTNTLLQQSASPASPGSDRSLLPAEIWQHIFTFVPPRELGNLLLTNRAFHSYLNTSLTEVDLLLSLTPSLIIPALPSVLLTEDTNILSPGALQNGHGHSDGKLTKLFYTKHVEELKEEFATVKTMGLATAEEWLKGLDDRGKELRADSSRWEKWESSGGVSQMQKTLYQAQVEPPLNTSHEETSLGAPNQVPQDGNVQSSTGLSIPVFTTVPADALTKPITHLAPSESNAPTPTTLDHCLPDPGRDPRAEGGSAARDRTQAALLEPPLLANVLAHIPSFQAALQIIQPLDSNAWDLLKPRLLSQREDAEIRASQDQRLKAHSTDTRVKAEDRRDANGAHRESKELVDKDWDDAQAHLRATVSEYADETIKNAWHDGHKVKKDSCPKFAADVLLYVRKRFYAEVAKDAVAARAAGQEPTRDPPEGPFTQKLTLENMKWLFEVKIKPLTESYRKELFLCNGCDGNSKAYGFEGVIQHYAAKHTSSLSQGNIVVYWRSEWPATPPFHPDPLSKPTKPATSTPTTYPGIYQQQYPAQPPTNNFPQPHPFPLQGALGYGAPPYRPDYGSQQHSHYPQYPAPQPPFPIPPSYNASYHTSFERPIVPQQHLPPMTSSFQQQQNFPSPYENNFGVYQGSHITYDLYSEDKIRAQLDDLAFNSRDVWMALTSLRNLPGNIRVSIVIFHLTKRYRSRFSESPPLAMFIDGLSNKKDMRPVRNINGLKCKACHLHPDDGAEVELRTFSLPQLANHFQQNHVDPFQGAGAPFLDWTVDMIHVPDLSGLQNLSGMNAQKEALVTEAFPGLMVSFPYRQPPAVIETGSEWIGTEGQPPTVTGTHHEGSGNTVTASPSVTGGAGYIHTASRYDTTLLPENRYALAQNKHDQERQVLPISHPPQPGAPLNSSPGYGARPSITPKQELHGRSRDRKYGFKEKRKGPNHSSSKRKGDAKSNDAAVKIGRTSHDERDGEAEAEESRQEEAIRAMWAAERREAAQLASTPGVRKEEKRNSPRSGGTSQMAKRVVKLSRSPRPIQTGAHNDPWTASRTVETEPGDDLFAGLESHLNQQTCSDPNVTGRVAMYDRQPIYEPHHVRISQPVALVRPASQAMHSGFASYERTSPPSNAREGDRLQAIHYREPSSQPHQEQAFYTSSALTPSYNEGRIAGPVLTVHDTAIEHMRLDGTSRNHLTGERAEQILRNPSADGYVDEAVRMRDAEGEYLIRRPVRREMEAAYAGPGRLEYREMGYSSTHYGPGNITISLAHERPRDSEGILRRSLREESREAGSLHYEEYDPRFGSAPPNPEAHVYYQ